MRVPLLARRVALAAIVVGGLLALALWPSAIPVEMAVATRGPLTVTITEEGRTRVSERYVVSAPVSGSVLRIGLQPGDRVGRGQVVARVRAGAPPLLDARSRAEAQAAVDSARAALGQARAEEQRARTQLAQLQRDLARAHELARADLLSRQDLEAREAAARAGEESAKAASFAVGTAESELQRAAARLNPAVVDSGRIVAVTAPADGVVLRRLHESETTVPAGEPLLEVGDPERLEIVADLLSTDAVRVPAGAKASIAQWGGARLLEAAVRRVEPAGFTKISALGVEEQRVNVVLDFRDPASAWAALGDAYRVEVNIVTWHADDVLKVPTGALFRVQDAWAIYLVEDNRVRQRRVTIGHQTGRETEITQGVAEGQHIVVNPPDTLAEGVRVYERTSAR